MKKIHWVRCSLKSGDLDRIGSFVEGVYIIWSGLSNSIPVYVGQGNIRERLTAHLSNPRILVYQELYVTWAVVFSRVDRDGIEAYLGAKLAPIVSEVYPSAHPIPVPLPSPLTDLASMLASANRRS